MLKQDFNYLRAIAETINDDNTKSDLLQMCRAAGWAGDENRCEFVVHIDGEESPLRAAGKTALAFWLADHRIKQAAADEQAVDVAQAERAAAVEAAPQQQQPPKPAPAVAPVEAAQQLLGLVQSLAGAAIDEAKVRAIAAEEAAKVERPANIQVNIPNQEPRIIEGRQHRAFPDLLAIVGAGVQAWIAGPAGSGKTTAAEKAAEALGLPFYFTGAIDTEYKLLGFRDAGGTVHRTEFREAFEHGGLFLFDEVDGSGPNATLAFQAALANGICAFPDGMIKRHKDFRCIAAANTWGLGATADYVGRNRLDAAFLDRFVQLAWDYDTELERAIAGNDEWTGYVQTMRGKARAKGLKVVISPRASIHGAKLLHAGMPRATVEQLTIFGKLTPEQVANLKAG